MEYITTIIIVITVAIKSGLYVRADSAGVDTLLLLSSIVLIHSPYLNEELNVQLTLCDELA
jgi:hypothetical protein